MIFAAGDDERAKLVTLGVRERISKKNGESNQGLEQLKYRYFIL